MAKLITFTSIDGETVFVNPAHVALIAPDGANRARTALHLAVPSATGGHVIVILPASADMVADRINAAP